MKISSYLIITGIISTIMNSILNIKKYEKSIKEITIEEKWKNENRNMYIRVGIENIIMILISIELILIGMSINYIEISRKIDDMIGINNSILLLTLGAVESAIAITILILIRK